MAKFKLFGSLYFQFMERWIGASERKFEKMGDKEEGLLTTSWLSAQNEAESNDKLCRDGVGLGFSS